MFALEGNKKYRNGLFVFSVLLLVISIGLSQLINRMPIWIFMIAIVSLIFSLSAIVTTPKKVEESDWYDKFNFMIGILTFVVTIIFSIITYDISKQFSPVVIGHVAEKEMATKKNGDVIFTARGLPIDDIRMSDSGRYRKFLIGGHVTFDKKDKKEDRLVLESLLTKDGYVNKSQPIYLNLNRSRNAIEFKSMNLPSGQIFIMFDPDAYSNMLYLYAEDYVGGKEYIFYILSFTENQKIRFQPLLKSEIYSNNRLLKIYESINFKEDIFWKKEEIDSFDTFQKKLIERYEQLKKVIED